MKKEVLLAQLDTAFVKVTAVFMVFSLVLAIYCVYDANRYDGIAVASVESSFTDEIVTGRNGMWKGYPMDISYVVGGKEYTNVITANKDMFSKDSVFVRVSTDDPTMCITLEDHAAELSYSCTFGFLCTMLFIIELRMARKSLRIAQAVEGL